MRKKKEERKASKKDKTYDMGFTPGVNSYVHSATMDLQEHFSFLAFYLVLFLSVCEEWRITDFVMAVFYISSLFFSMALAFTPGRCFVMVAQPAGSRF